MKYLILGCNTMIGHVIFIYLRECGHYVIGYDEFESQYFSNIKGSYYNHELIKNCIVDGMYDAIINCTSVINQAAENNKALAVYINAYFPHYLEAITKEMDTILVHRSTDCIFSGSRGNYSIKDLPDGNSFYARSKALGEIQNEKDITIRTSLIGPEQDKNGVGLLNWFVNQVGDVSGYANSFWTGLTTLEYAKIIDRLVTNRAHGLFQCVPKSKISKYELLKIFNKYIPGGRNVTRIENEYIDRSLVQYFGSEKIIIPKYEQMVFEMVEWINSHRSVYKNNIKLIGESKL